MALYPPRFPIGARVRQSGYALRADRQYVLSRGRHADKVRAQESLDAKAAQRGTVTAHLDGRFAVGLRVQWERYTVPCPSGDVQIIHTAYSGCSRLPSDPEGEIQAMARLAFRVARYRKQGYPVDILAGDETYPRAIEVGTPDDAALVGDVEGTYRIAAVQVPAAQCYDCGELVPIGDTCPCHEFREE